MKISAAVIGLGKIGLTSDLTLSPAEHVFTHARAFAMHPAFRLLGGMDPARTRCQEMTETYGCPACTSVPELLTACQPEVVAIAAATAAHASLVRQVLEHSRPRAILCEKPLSHDIGEAREIVAACRAAGCELFVNYIRRADPAVQEVRRRIDAGEISTPLKGVVWYSKGLLHNGSHFFDLMQYWLGDLVSALVVAPGRDWQGDPEPDLLLSFARGRIHFLAAREEDYSHYTAELVSPSGRLRYDLGGWKLVWQPAVPSPTTSGYTVLDRVEHEIPSHLARIQWLVADQLKLALSGEQHCLCSGQEALGALEHLTSIKNSL